MDEIICSIHAKPSAFIEKIKIIKYQLHYDFVLCLSTRDNFFLQRLNAITSIWDLVSATPLKPWNGFNWNFIQRNYLMCRYAKLLTFCSAASKKGDMRKVRLGDPFVSSFTVPLVKSDLIIISGSTDIGERYQGYCGTLVMEICTYFVVLVFLYTYYITSASGWCKSFINSCGNESLSQCL